MGDVMRGASVRAIPTPRPESDRLSPGVAGPPKKRGRIRAIRAWMLVPPVDAIMIVLPMLWAPQHAKALLATAVITVLLVTNGRCYRARLHLSVLDEFPRLVAKLLTATAIVATVTALRHEQDAVTSFLVLSLGGFGLFIAGRLLTTQIILWSRRRRIVSHRTVIVGSGPIATDLSVILNRYPQYGLKVEGFVDEVPGPAAAVASWLGSLDDLERIANQRDIGVILVADGGSVEEAVLAFVRRPPPRARDLLVVPRLHQLNTHIGLPDHVGSIPVLRINSPRLRGPAWAAKRACDIVVSAAALVPLLPVLAICALAVRIETGPGVLFRQQRVGRDGKLFDCLKFRSMTPGDAGESATTWSIASDTRVGPVGRILRKYSLDELPQLWNILRGDMTLVGPRPERPYFVDKFSAEIPRYEHRHRVRAGLTGLAQVSGLRGDTPVTDRARFDNYYIENWSLWMDTKILLRTVGEIISARGR